MSPFNGAEVAAAISHPSKHGCPGVLCRLHLFQIHAHLALNSPIRDHGITNMAGIPSWTLPMLHCLPTMHLYDDHVICQQEVTQPHYRQSEESILQSCVTVMLSFVVEFNEEEQMSASKQGDGNSRNSRCRDLNLFLPLLHIHFPALEERAI